MGIRTLALVVCLGRGVPGLWHGRVKVVLFSRPHLHNQMRIAVELGRNRIGWQQLAAAFGKCGFVSVAAFGREWGLWLASCVIAAGWL